MASDATYGDTRRWNALNGRWFTSGRPYREIDRIDGTPNPILQRQLQHVGAFADVRYTIRACRIIYRWR